MPQRNYLTSATALSLTASGTTITSGNTTAATFELSRTMVRTGISAGELANGSRTWSIHYVVSAMTTPYEMRLKLQRRNSAGVMQSESSYGTVRSATGTFDDNITWDSGAWAANDQLAVVWEHRRPSGTGSKNGTVDANGASYVDAATPIVTTTLTPATVALTATGFIAQLLVKATPAAATITTTRFTPSLRLVITPATSALTTSQLAPSLRVANTPATASLATTRFAPALYELLVPTTQALNTATFAPVVRVSIAPVTTALITTTFAPALSLTDNTLVIVPSVSLTLTSTSPLIRPFPIIFLDPGGDAVQAVGYFNTVIADGSGISYDTTEQVVGVGSYKFDSGASLNPTVSVNDILGSSVRLSAYWRYDSVPDDVITTAEFVVGDGGTYSGDFWAGTGGFTADDGVYATATPARNAGQGRVFGSLGLDIPAGSIIDSVKIIYERNYDTNASIGISRVKYRINSVEGPDHDNTDEPLTDTVVEIDVTGDRTWERQDLLDGVFEVIAEARRGDTDIEHTQSWDYVKVEVEFHLPNAILATPIAAGVGYGWQIAVTPKGSAVVLRFVDGVGESYDGITEIPVDTWARISLGYVYHGVDNFDIKIYLNGIQELFISEASTGGVDLMTNPDLYYGWLTTPGVDHLCWFDQLYIDSGDDLSDCGNSLITAKLSAAVNENNWNTTGGTGAVNERPLSETNYVEEATGIALLRQSYTLQTAATGDEDLSGESLLGYMGWAWVKVSQIGEAVDLIVNNVLASRLLNSTSAQLVKHPVTTTNYPSHAAGIGMRNAPELIDTFMYECGAVITYEGALEEFILPYQRLTEDSLTNLTDDLRVSLPVSYELCHRIDEGEASVLIAVHSIASEGESPQFQGGTGGQGGSGRMRITPGIEVQVRVEVTGGSANVAIWHRLNVD